MRCVRILRLRPFCVCLVGALALMPHHRAKAQSAIARTADWMGESGLASYYARWHQGRRTASGSRFNEHALTAAHAWLPFGTLVRVTLAGTRRSVVVVITDRMEATGRVIDLSRAAARKLGMLGEGIARVSLSPG